MRLPAVRTAVATALAAGLLAASTVSAAPVGDETTFFLRKDGCGATEEAGRLSVESGKDGSDGCGFIGGPPLDEAFYLADGTTLSVYDFTTVDGVPLTLDASRDVSGVLATRSWTGTGGAGEVVMDVALFATRIGTNGRPQSVPIGSGTFSTTALPTSTVYKVPFTLDVPDTLAGVEVTSLSLSVAPRGLNWNAGAQSYSGTSLMTVPTIVDDGADAG